MALALTAAEKALLDMFDVAFEDAVASGVTYSGAPIVASVEGYGHPALTAALKTKIKAAWRSCAAALLRISPPAGSTGVHCYTKRFTVGGFATSIEVHPAIPEQWTILEVAYRISLPVTGLEAGIFTGGGARVSVDTAIGTLGTHRDDGRTQEDVVAGGTQLQLVLTGAGLGITGDVQIFYRKG